MVEVDEGPDYHKRNPRPDHAEMHERIPEWRGRIPQPEERGKEKTFYVELQPNKETQKKLEARSNAQAEVKPASQSEEQNIEAEPAVQAQEEPALGEIK